ncbi:MAG TPA: CaiB/BaiF CoA-transferase family protein, partial [Steroidobacteraceae bacterium]|nr:CaiB/BaiF CoA-transferase family protein [Steroidobacteraceae bacterium]
QMIIEEERMSGVYEGLTVVELADRRNQWAGKLLSDGGARVIQIESVNGSPGRWCGPFVKDKVDPDNCLDYWWNNTGKQSVALDIERKPAQDLLRQLLTRADIFLESTAPGTLAKLGLDYGAVAGNRALIYASLTDFGQDGPWRDWQMNDAAHLALGGQMSSTGYSDATVTPIGGQGHQAWHMGCAFVLHGITVALFDRMTSGEGQYIDVSIHDACAIGTEGAVPQWMYYGETMYRQTGMHAAPRRLPPLELPTADGMYVMAINQAFNKRSWDALLDWMDEKGVTGELRNPKYQEDSARTAEYRQGTIIRDAIRRLIAASNAEECFHRAQTSGISWAVIRAAEENYDIPHYQQRDYWRNVEHPQLGRAIPYPRGPFACDELQLEPRGRAPHLGEHTQQVLAHDLGLTAEKIAALTAAGVIK